MTDVREAVKKPITSGSEGHGLVLCDTRKHWKMTVSAVPLNGSAWLLYGHIVGGNCESGKVSWGAAALVLAEAGSVASTVAEGVVRSRPILGIF